MSYLVLSLKYRPQTFDEVVGQDHITQTLTNAFSKDRISQGYLFTGPRGVGKTTTARLVAKALNCMESPGQPCNKCSNCIEITDGRNMDVLEIDGASNRGIEEIRGLREAIQYSPINSKFKVFIIDEVHMLTTQAFNALLRTLEEPPAHGKFILATTDIYKVPATIISRCQRFDFNSISVKTISEQIKFVLNAEKIEIDDDSLRIIAQKADGSLRDALSILDQVIAYSGENITFDSVSRVLGLIPTEVYFNLMETILNKNGKAMIDILSDLKATGMPLQEFVSGMNRHLRNMTIATIENGLDALDLNIDLKEQYANVAKSWKIKDLMRISKIITDIEPQIKRAVQPHILMELSLLKLLEFDSTVSIESLLKQVNNPTAPIKNTSETISSQPIKISNNGISAQLDSKPAIIIKKDVVKPEEKPNNKISEPENIAAATSVKNLNIEDVLANWSDFIETISSERPSVGNVLSHCELSQITGNRLEIKLVNSNNFNLRTLEKNKVIIEKYLEKVYDTKVKTVFLMTKAVVKKTIQNDNDNNLKTTETTAKIIELFDGEIIN